MLVSTCLFHDGVIWWLSWEMRSTPFYWHSLTLPTFLVFPILSLSFLFSLFSVFFSVDLLIFNPILPLLSLLLGHFFLVPPYLLFFLSFTLLVSSLLSSLSRLLFPYLSSYSSFSLVSTYYPLNIARIRSTILKDLVVNSPVAGITRVPTPVIANRLTTG